MRFEYTIKIYSLDQLRVAGIDIEEENNIVYACRSDGECEIHEVGIEQLDNLSGILNAMGNEGWELIELFFHQSGIITFWKRAIEAS
ncbi:MAG: hypothetical protein H6Q52_1364 [Deltaproteobacteria bacterium]|nr:hypothetical protein [Deltaproteobacteria bacterium]